MPTNTLQAHKAGKKLATKLMADGVIGVIDPYGIARNEAKIGMRKLGTLAEKLEWERMFNAGFREAFIIEEVKAS